MTKTRILAAAFGLAIVSVGCSTALASGEHPPHVEPPKAEASAPLPLTVVGGDHPAQVVTEYRAFMEGVAREAWFAGVEAAALDNVARQRAVRSLVGGSFPGDCQALAAELGLSTAVLWRESRCSRDAYNATGCGGRGCLGAAQVDAGHFAGTSPWNRGVAGTCADLDPSDPAQYGECVSRLPDSAWG